MTGAERPNFAGELDLGGECQKLRWFGSGASFAMLIVPSICHFERYRVKGKCVEAEQGTGHDANGHYRLQGGLGPPVA